MTWLPFFGRGGPSLYIQGVSLALDLHFMGIGERDESPETLVPTFNVWFSLDRVNRVPFYEVSNIASG